MRPSSLIKAFTCVGICLSFAMVPHANAQDAEDGYVGFNEIVDTLDPLEFLSNDGGVRRSIDLDIRFAFNSADLAKETLRQLDVLGDALRGGRLLQYSFQVAGHTDAKGDAAYNKALSKRRADAVRTYILENYSIAPERLVTIGFGEEQLRDPKQPEAPLNRRVEVSVIQSEATTEPSGALPNSKRSDGEKVINW